MIYHSLSASAGSLAGASNAAHNAIHEQLATGCPQHYVSSEAGIPACPKSKNLTILPAHYPPRTLFVGYSPEPSYLAFLSTLIERNAKRARPLQIVVLIPRFDTEQAYEDLKFYIQRSQAQHLTFITTPSDETLWMQDYLEIGLSLKDGRLKLIDLPYIDREGEAIPAAIALSCQFDLIPQPKDSTSQDQNHVPLHGNYGGNIEALPGNLLLIGNTMSQLTQQHLHRIFQDMTIMKIDVSWLETGHVDELFSVLPDRSTKAACPFAMTYTSPKLALELMQKNKFSREHGILPTPASIMDVSLELQEASLFSECFSAYAQKKEQPEQCQRLIQANIAYEQKIQQERKRIDTVLVKQNSCPNINWIALPQLFVPSYEIWMETDTWGSDQDQAQAINPNTINMIALGEDVVIAEQPYKPFAQEVSRRLKELNLSPILVDSALSHYLSGGLHCNTAIARMCGVKP
jgi:hypothetical protein